MTSGSIKNMSSMPMRPLLNKVSIFIYIKKNISTFHKLGIFTSKMKMNFLNLHDTKNYVDIHFIIQEAFNHDFYEIVHN